MPRKGLSMRQVRAVLRLKWAVGGAECSWGRAGRATQIWYAFGISRQRFQRRPRPDAMLY